VEVVCTVEVVHVVWVVVGGRVVRAVVVVGQVVCVVVVGVHVT
jgi:hypothetical protein